MRQNRKWLICTMALIFILTFAGCASRNSATPESDGNGVNQGQNAAPSSPSANDPQQGENGEPSPPPQEEATDPIVDQLDQLTTAEKIGQLVLVGMSGTVPDEHTRKLIETYHVGGFIFYKDNIENSKQALKLINRLKEDNSVNPLPLFLSVDEEGGRVTRMPKEYAKIPTAASIGSTGDPKAAETFYGIIGDELSGFGLNLDFAPVLDVNSNPDNPVIGDRSFGNTPEAVSKMGLAAMEGLSGKGVIPVVKHFPGHGDTSVDSHLGLPVVNHDLQRLKELELVPFQAAIESGTDMVMIAHLLLPKLDPDYPSSFSKAVIHDLLREELGYEGVIVSDDMTMGAITENYSIEQAAVEFITAGGNIVLVGHDYEKEESVIRAITEAVKQGTISEEMLDERVSAILKLKAKYKLSGEPADGPDRKAVNAAIKEALKQYGLQ
ncbi:beta-N-acetylhexosaminidase [Fontibacillus phaseoli]|uniref:Beta-N-acetylhexosaminidase n=1 Tax=Fontibacillus phaseoli TaxID=1416533 RepID=A0A369BEN8_9BACL|nr:beta-N-acetylhexosaminidase [Fontibacillus phaseoli]RCX19735.1 beta-N-acetylhexosaminidase [Fontibacillus phaseoli]